MLGSSLSISGPNIILNTIVAEELEQFADILENAADFKSELNTLIRKTIHDHKRIIFNGNGYDNAWVEEAERRGLLNLKTTPEALERYVDEKNIALFTKHKIFTKEEIYSRRDILYDVYSKTLSIEALTMIDMAKKDIIPAIIKYQRRLAELVKTKKELEIMSEPESSILKRLSELCSNIYDKTEQLETSVNDSKDIVEDRELSFYYKNNVLPVMQSLRESADEAELLIGRDYWPFPTYGDLLFSV